MYKNELPNHDDLVVVKVKSIEDFGAFVSLLEYNNIEGMIMSSEVSRKRIRSIHKHLRIGRQDVMQVLRVDKEKGYIDLSKKNVTDDNVNECTEKYTKAKTVHSIMKHVALSAKVPLRELLEKVAWKFYDEYDHALTGLVNLVKNPDLVASLDLDPAVKEILVKEVSHRLSERPIKVQAEIEVTCNTSEGIDAIKPSLIAGKSLPSGETVEIHLLSTPVYRMTYQCQTKQQGVDVLNESIEIIKNEILGRNGGFNIKTPPSTIHE